MAERTDVKGYVVLREGIALQEATQKGQEGVLYFPGSNQPGTIFPSRGIAERRLRRTLEYSDSLDAGWRRWRHRIQPIRGTAEPVS